MAISLERPGAKGSHGTWWAMNLSFRQSPRVGHKQTEKGGDSNRTYLGSTRKGNRPGRSKVKLGNPDSTTALHLD